MGYEILTNGENLYGFCIWVYANFYRLEGLFNVKEIKIYGIFFALCTDSKCVLFFIKA